MAKRISLSDVARACGVSIPAVSFALRNGGNLSHTTREKIKAAARQLGYQPNPLLAALASKHFRAIPHKGTPLAYLHPREKVLLYSIFPEDLRELQDYSRGLGFELELYHPQDFQNGAHATRVLYSRGVQGIVLSPAFQAHMLPGMEWGRFSVVGWGESLAAPMGAPGLTLYRTHVDHFNAVIRLWDEVIRRGYQRIGFALFKLRPGSSDDLQRWAAAQACLRHVPRSRRVPLYTASPNGIFGDPRYRQWLQRHRPDAVVGFNAVFLGELVKLGYQVPRDIAFASLHIASQTSLPSRSSDEEAGMPESRMESMKAALDLLDQQVRHHQYGLPRQGRLQLIQPEWKEGATLPYRCGT